MIRKFANINDFKYCIEYDNYTEKAANYVMIRNFVLLNDVVCDNNLYFIEEKLLEQLKEQIRNKEQIDCLVFPAATNLHYSNHYTLYNDLMIDADITDELSVYHLLEIDQNKQNTDEVTYFKKKSIKQDLIKIYHPHIKTSQNNIVVHVDNIINNIHIHYICNLYKNFPVKSETEIREVNNIYSEYIEVYIPDVKDLFGISFDENGNQTYSTYYLEDLNIIDTTSPDNFDFIKEIIKFDENHDQMVPLGLLTQPFLLNMEKDPVTFEEIYKKKYFKHNISVGNNFLITPINVTLFPFDYVDTTNNLYILDKELKPASESFGNEYKFKINTVCDFSDGTISLITTFDYPEKELFDNKFGEEYSLSKAYCYFNGITDIDKYNKGYEAIYDLYTEELDEIRHITEVPEEDKKFMVHENAYVLTMSANQIIEEYKRLKMESFLEEYIEEYKADINFFGFKVEISSDKDFKYIIYSDSISLSNNFIKNQISSLYDEEVIEDKTPINLFSCLNNNAFAFKVSNLFDNWLQMPEIIVARVYFIDRFLGNIIQSNDVVINKEKFKYIINDIDYYRENTLTNFNSMIHEYTALNKDAFNFIDKVNCTVHNDTENNAITISQIKEILASNYTDKLERIQNIIDQKNKQVSVINTNNSLAHIVYKPVFFKTSTGDNIQIRRNQIQNIGIDIHEYSRQAELFIVNIDNKQYKETARNTNYAIFNIDAKALENTSGTYDLYNESYEYITSGSWILV